MTTSPLTCPLGCGSHPQIGPDAGGRQAVDVSCEICGQFVLSAELRDLFQGAHNLRLSDPDRQLLPYLRAHTRQFPKVGPELTTENWREWALAHRSTSVPRKLEMILAHLAEQSVHPGAPVVLDLSTTYPLFDAASEQELHYLLDHLRERGYLKSSGLGPTGTDQLTPDGWARLEPPTTAGLLGRCFIAMWFNPALTEAYEGIDSAVRKCGLTPVRIDRVPHNEKICDKILAAIRQAQFVIADVTGHPQGVYFEAGFAMGLGRPVICTCRKDALDGTHFDTRQYNHIVWTSPEDLHEQLVDRIQATIL